MKICKQIENLLPLYYTGDLDESDKRLVENHLEDCPTCRQFSHEIQYLLNDLQPDPVNIDPNYGAELVVKIQNRLHNEWRPRKLRSYLVPVLASILIFIIIGFNLVRNPSGSSQWLSNDNIIDFYMDLTHSGYFSEMPDDAFDFLNLNENDLITNETRHKISTVVLATNNNLLIDDYVESIAYLTDQDFELVLKEIENSIF
ncbi:MAG TPA: zf-HC2 domain-containing protein [Candidatus Marinimicrobia bacterium]|nr:zf-HC2 domain-containing protein [Candidatus Neomarinimicrobiota bacterium]HRS51811.1 zf-HC2 domain-containing protein [Candidatus Neomarinimicrobiota bacterium]HRU92637.1 zf-HC2 domain-containing protein [Candidatus Neomarinimicrobiota bacterium]